MYHHENERVFILLKKLSVNLDLHKNGLIYLFNTQYTKYSLYACVVVYFSY